jgi:Peptidase family C25
MADHRIVANGISGLTGNYLIEPLAPADLAACERPTLDTQETARWLRMAWETISQPTYGLPFDVRPENVAEAGWGVVVSTEDGTGVLKQLEPLLQRRREQTGNRFRILEHRPGETWPAWLGRHGVGPGTIDPEKVPYYLLIAGSPSLVPFSFQYLLDVEYAVGRLHFDDAGAYRDYADAVVTYESVAAPPHDDTVVFFGTRHPFDTATESSADHLVGPLARCFGLGGQFERIVGEGRTRTVVGETATKHALAEIIDGRGAHGRPALILAATHGMGGWPSGHPEQRLRHGSLLCQDWPGFGQIDPAYYYAGSDLGADARLHGMIAFFFACYSAGTPQYDSFTYKPGTEPPVIAPEPFVAALPQRLLAHPGGGALAVIGHVERAWGYSFIFGEQAQLNPFQNTIGRILTGQPIGYAMKDFNERYAALSTNLTAVLEDVSHGRTAALGTLARQWTERNDAQNYILLGDPAVVSRRT